MESNEMNRTITTDSAPAAIGPYSQAVKAGEWIYLSGQIPLDPETGSMKQGSVQEATIRVMENLKAVLEAAGASLRSVVRVTIYLTDMNDFGQVNEIYASYFEVDPPARATVEVSRLPKDALVEMDAVAFLG